MERLCLDKMASAAVDEYLDYRRIVGEYDGGRLFSPEEYEDYKMKVLPQRLKNRLYVSFGVPRGKDCKLIGPETPCFCTHRYKEHRTDFEVVSSERPLALRCLVRGCPCAAYEYVPLNGSQPIRCRCKHPADNHNADFKHLCRKCTSCTGFQSPFTCGCGEPTSAHQTLVETRQEREARGRPVGLPVPYAAMGGLTGFSSLAEGYLRLDDSGIGAPPLDTLTAGPAGALQHVFEKAYGPTSEPAGQHIGWFYLWTYRSEQRLEAESSRTQVSSNLRTKEEEDMAYFERRYQERLKAERLSAREKILSTSSSSSLSTKPPATAANQPIFK